MIHGTMAGHDGIGYSADSPILDLAAAIVKAAVEPKSGYQPEAEAHY